MKLIVYYNPCNLFRVYDVNPTIPNLTKHLVSYQKRLPRKYARHKRARKYCSILNSKFKELTGCDYFYIELYSSKNYTFELLDDKDFYLDL